MITNLIKIVETILRTNLTNFPGWFIDGSFASVKCKFFKTSSTQQKLFTFAGICFCFAFAHEKLTSVIKKNFFNTKNLL